MTTGTYQAPVKDEVSVVSLITSITTEKEKKEAQRSASYVYAGIQPIKDNEGFEIPGVYAIATLMDPEQGKRPITVQELIQE